MLTDNCIVWTKAKTAFGYGKFKKNGRMYAAHRVAWEEKNGPIPNGMLVCHKCDNPPCYNVDHLFLGTYGDNNKDCYDKKRRSAPSKPKITEQTAIRIKMLKGVLAYKKIAQALGVAESYVINIANGKRFSNVTSQTRYGI